MSRIKHPVTLHHKLLQMVYDNSPIEADIIKKFIKDKYSFNDTTIMNTYRRLCNSGFVSVVNIDKVKFLVFKRG